MAKSKVIDTIKTSVVALYPLKIITTTMPKGENVLHLLCHLAKLGVSKFTKS